MWAKLKRLSVGLPNRMLRVRFPSLTSISDFRFVISDWFVEKRMRFKTNQSKIRNLKSKIPVPEFSVQVWARLPNFLLSPLEKKHVISSHLTNRFRIWDCGSPICSPKSRNDINFLLEGKPNRCGSSLENCRVKTYRGSSPLPSAKFILDFGF